MHLTAERPTAGHLADSTEGAIALAKFAAAALASVSRRVHPAWVESLGKEVAVVASKGPALLDELLLSHFDLRWPDLSAVSHGPEYLWLLPVEQVKRFCSARALYTWRDALDRCVVAQMRRQARALVGNVAFEALIARPDPRPHSVALPETLDGDEVCALGWLHLKAGLPWRDARSRRLVDLMFPPTAVTAPPGAADDHDLFMADLPAMFPELSWLFGSNPATTT